jgi:Domain of unknown function (DUF4249)
MKKLIYVFILIKLSFFEIGCIDSVPFPTKSDEGFLSVEGTFNNLVDTQFIRLYNSKGYTATPEIVRNAKITVFSSDNKSGNYEEIRPGVYAFLPQILRGESGKSYFLEIKTTDNKIYRTEPETMPQPVKPDSISFNGYVKEQLSASGVKVKEKTLQILINTPSKSGNTDAFLRWNIEDSFQFATLSSCTPFGNTTTCYYSRKMPVSRLAIASSKDLQLNYIAALPVNEVSLKQFELQFKEIHYWQVSQNSITEKAYNYWKSVDKSSNQVGSLFDEVPAYVKSNIYNVDDKNEKVLGYFEVAAVEKIVRPLTRGLINQDYGADIYPKDQDPCGDFRFRQNTLCCQCQRYEINGWLNSPLKPSYWK